MAIMLMVLFLMSLVMYVLSNAIFATVTSFIDITIVINATVTICVWIVMLWVVAANIWTLCKCTKTPPILVVMLQSILNLFEMSISSFPLNLFLINLELFYKGNCIVLCVSAECKLIIFVCSSKYRATNLATTCKRIEKYRKKTSRFNFLRCSHCFSPTTINKLCESDLGLSTIFRRGVCQSILLENSDDECIKDIYVCAECTKNCDSCQPLDRNSESLDGYDLVYYLHPSHDMRNWGGFIDFGVNKVY